jgi:hypothetical protein
MKKMTRIRIATSVFIFVCLYVIWMGSVMGEQIWTDFSPKPVGEQDATTSVVVDHLVPIAQEVFGRGIDIDEEPTADIDKEKYRVYFEDESLVLMVLGGLEYWKMNCGTLTATGQYFMKLAIKKHGIDEEEMHMDMSFQTGLFAATLYNSCDHFLEQVKTIGLDMMFIKTEPTPMDPKTLNNIQDSEA